MYGMRVWEPKILNAHIQTPICTTSVTTYWRKKSARSSWTSMAASR